MVNVTAAPVQNSKARKAAAKAARQAQQPVAGPDASPAAVAPPVVAPAAQPLSPDAIAGLLAQLAAAGVAVVAPKAARQKIGVAPTALTRAYYAGAVLAKFGHSATLGVSPAMVAALDNMPCGPNATESAITLRNAWHAVRGYNGNGVPAGVVPAGVTVPDATPVTA